MKWTMVILISVMMFAVACTTPSADFVLENDPCVGVEKPDTCYLDLVEENQTFTCPLIQSDALRSICYVEAVKFDPQEGHCEQVSNSDKKLCFANLGIALADVRFCEKSEGSSKEFCKAAVFIETDALESCETVENKVWKDRCIDYFGRSTQDKNLCFQISTSQLRDACIYNVSMSLEDADLCNSIIGPSSEETFDSFYTTQDCVVDVAIATSDTAACDALENSIDSSACIFALATETGDVELCQEITFRSTLDKCLRVVGNTSVSE